YATGDYYTGMVDENQKEPLGVYIEDLKPANSKFYEDERVTVWGVLKARTLDPSKPISISTNCYAKTYAFEGEKTVSGDADPVGSATELKISTSTMEEKDLTCEFNSNSLKEGMWGIYISSTFNFDTYSYLKAYFMDQDRLRAFRRENKDPLDIYGITDKNPISLCTAGPIELNMQVTQPLTGLSRNPSERNEIVLGITIANRWSGKIKEIKDLTIKVPPAMSIVFCDQNIKEVACSGEECEEGKYKKVYKLQDKDEGGKRGKESLRDIEQFQSFRCRVNVDSVDGALGNTPIAIHNFKASTSYIYELTKSVNIDVQKRKTGEQI
ncbi:MAG: hypothetical protein N3D84_02595, partial [Candidatus Woesearchaeota archaeon]|nr:hypothetical protein [Candidatus Woesearchaeota archaeon]